MKNIARLAILLLLCGLGWLAWAKRGAINDLIRGKLGAPPAATPDLTTYLTLSRDLESHRFRLAQRYETATSDAERSQVLRDVRTLLEAALPRMMHCWLGTPWDFNGTAHQPGEDKVACGYFVASVMQDAQFTVEWGPLAQQPSQNILGTFLPNADMLIRESMDYETYLEEVRALGPGICIVGLDSHVAFLVIADHEIRFIHSSGTKPWCVVDESEQDADTLRRSRYRVIGNLTANPELLQKWLLGKPFPTRKG